MQYNFTCNFPWITQYIHEKGDENQKEHDMGNDVSPHNCGSSYNYSNNGSNLINVN